ncbi:J domain-containing protein [Devosia sp. ZB163]|uniref:J domain-containing protein n=1 Tax=Devosia sp. ZB163 TaxID=3025938 RepID=UPI002361142B|nr:J domain-containing protein [Devosia sp. ZB163]MDC9822662.1 J domain-containing protein [Devosia sp. ZB163]
MAANPYQVLGVKKDASQKEIQRVYRQLAKKSHPDLHPGDAEAEQKFKELTAAYELIGDADKRKRFDAGEIDASGQETPKRSYYRDFAGSEAGAGAYRSAAGFSDFGDAEDIFSSMFGGRSFRSRGPDIRYRLTIDFLDAVNGGTKQVTLADGSSIDVSIPPGTRDGQVLRLRGKGQPGTGGGPPGDALVEIVVRPHPFFTRDADDIRLELPISLTEAVLGGKVKAPTPTGTVMVTVPKWSSSGRVLRIRGRGVPRRDGSRGDAYARLAIVLPQKPDAELEKFATGWSAGKAHQPRQHMGV